jgi:hypothetical protein
LTWFSAEAFQAVRFQFMGKPRSHRAEVIRPRAARQNYVVRVDIAVADATVVGALNRFGQRGDPTRRQPRRDRPTLDLEPLMEAGSRADFLIQSSAPYVAPIHGLETAFT